MDVPCRFKHPTILGKVFYSLDGTRRTQVGEIETRPRRVIWDVPMPPVAIFEPAPQRCPWSHTSAQREGTSLSSPGPSGHGKRQVLSHNGCTSLVLGGCDMARCIIEASVQFLLVSLLCYVQFLSAMTFFLNTRLTKSAGIQGPG